MKRQVFPKGFFVIAGSIIISSCKLGDPDALPDNIEYKASIINLNGKFVIPPIYDQIATHTENGQFFAQQKLPQGESNGQDGYDIIFDLEGQIFRKALLTNGLDWHFSYKYENDDVRRYNVKPKNQDPNFIATLDKGKYGFKNKDGVWVIPPQWDYVLGFENNVCFVWSYDQPFSRWGLIDKKGHYLLRPTCVYIERFDPEQPLRVCRIPFTFDGKQL